VPRPRFAKLDPAKQEAILHAALDAFASEGYEGASYNQIIERSGISKGAMYYYFDDKEDLYVTVVRHELEELLQRFHQLPEVKDAAGFWRMLADIMMQAQAFVAAEPKKIMLLRSLMKLRSQGTRSPLIQELYELGRSFSEAMIRLGQSVGAVRADMPFALMVNLITAVDEAGDRWMLEHVDLQDAEAMSQYGELFIDLLRRMVESR
jgi:AcrR family transcriptional regulator